MWRAQSQPRERERDGGGGQQECEPQMVANYKTMRVPARTKELIAARDGETLSRETLNLSTYLPPTFCLVKWDGGFRNNWKKCLRGGVGIGNSAERGMWAGERYNSTPIMLKRLMRAAPSSHKSSSSPGLDNLLGNFLMLLIVSAAEWLRREYWRGWQVGDKWEYSQQLHFKMQSDSTQGPSFFWIKAFWDILNVIRVSFWSLEHSSVPLNPVQTSLATVDLWIHTQQMTLRRFTSCLSSQAQSSFLRSKSLFHTGEAQDGDCPGFRLALCDIPAVFLC